MGSRQSPFRAASAVIAVLPCWPEFPLADVIALIGKAHASWSKILEALDYYGISHAAKAVYPKGSSYQLPECCIVGNANRFLLWYQGAFCGVTNVDQKKTVSYIEVYADFK